MQYFLDPFWFNLALSLAVLWPLWRIFRRAGLNPVWSLLIFVSVAQRYSLDLAASTIPRSAR